MVLYVLSSVILDLVPCMVIDVMDARTVQMEAMSSTVHQLVATVHRRSSSVMTERVSTTDRDVTGDMIARMAAMRKIVELLIPLPTNLKYPASTISLRVLMVRVLMNGTGVITNQTVEIIATRSPAHLMFLLQSLSGLFLTASHMSLVVTMVRVLKPD